MGKPISHLIRFMNEVLAEYEGNYDLSPERRRLRSVARQLCSAAGVSNPDEIVMDGWGDEAAYYCRIPDGKKAFCIQPPFRPVWAHYLEAAQQAIEAVDSEAANTALRDAS